MLMKTDDIYQETPSQQYPVTGRNLAHAKRSVAERAFVGADLHLDRSPLVSPTIRQSAYLAGVCVSYVAAAITIADDLDARAAVLAGDRPLLDAARSVAPQSLAERFAQATPAEWAECARAVGPAAVWDHMIAPLV